MMAGFVLLLVSLAAPGYYMWRDYQMRRMSQYDLMALIAAEKAFFEQYEVGPLPDEASDHADLHLGRRSPNRVVMNILRGIDGPGNIVQTNRVAFLEYVAEVGDGLSGVDTEGNFIDPWGHPYEMIVDANGDGDCFSATAKGGGQKGHRIIAWSCGPDGEPDTRDDILSWKL